MADSGDGSGDGALGRSRLDVLDVLEPLMLVPHLLVSGAVVLALGQLIARESPVSFSPDAAGWMVLGLWLGLGLLPIWPPVGGPLRRLLFRLRRPTQDERARVETAWLAVAQDADLSSTSHALLISSTRRIHSCLSGLGFIVLTRHALTSLPPDQLRAAVAHELGHSQSLRSAVQLASLWYTIPANIVVVVTIHGVMLLYRVIRTCYGIIVSVLSMVRPLRIILSLIAFPCFAYFAFTFWSVFFILTAQWLLPLITVGLATTWMARAADKRADRLAARLGYGQALMTLLASQPPEEVADEWIDRITTPYPTAGQREQALGRFMAKNNL